MANSVLNFLVLLLPLAVSCMPLSSHYTYTVFMDPEEMYQLHWSVRGDRLRFAAQVNTTGWIGLGIAKGLAGKMEGSDIVIGYVVNGKGHLTDRYAEGNYLPAKDDIQDYIMEGAYESDGQTVIQFNRKIISCDTKDGKMDHGTVKFLYAYNDVDPTPDDEGSIRKHSHRGSKSMNLRSYVSNSPPPSGLQSVTTAMERVNVPPLSTTYWCKSFKMPDMGGKRHIIEIEPIIQAGHESLVHHIVVYSCASSFKDSHLNVTGHCYTGNMPPSVKECAGISPAFAWAIGSKNFKFPSHVGLPYGGPAESPYFVVEVHYDNPELKTDYIDSSGLRFYLSNTLRQYDAGMMQVGASVGPQMIIPPEQKQWTTHGYCHPECSLKFKSDSALGGNYVNIIGGIPHAHLAGRQISTSIVRNGKEIEGVIDDQSYDFNFQQTLLFDKEIKFTAGDGLSTTCVYDTSDRVNTTVGGLGTKEEMCISFLLYYPRQNLTTCSSYELFADYLFKPKHKGWKSGLWSKDMIDDFRNFTNGNLSISVCIGQESHTHDVTRRAFTDPRIFHPLPKPTSPCDALPASSGSLKSSIFVVLLLIPATFILH